MPTTQSYTYDTLIAAIEDYIEDVSQEFQDNLQQIVGKGESRLYTDLNFEIFDRIDTGTLTAGTNEQAIKVPEWQATRSLWITPVGGGERMYLLRRTVDYCQDYQPDPSVDQGIPLYFAELDETTIFVSPAPDDDYPYRLRQVEGDTALALGPSNQTTWLSINAGDLLHYACMIEAEHFVVSEQYDANRWKNLYAETLPARRGVMREQLRSEYSPTKNAARTASPQP